jgi:FkbM family methyltransferase
MKARTIKGVIQKILNRFGYQLIRKAKSPSDAFAVQRELVVVIEPVIFDIGAHSGAVTEIYRELFPLASIHCFEPYPQSFKILSKRMRGDSRTFCHEIAMCEKRVIATLNANLSPSTNSLLSTDERAAWYWGKGLLETTSQVKVNTTTVDAFCLESGIPNIDILKMDVQGAEYSILEGARHTLANQKISLIYTELILGPTYKGQRKLHEYLSFLDSYGYNLLNFFNPVRRHNQLIQIDAVFLSTSLRRGIPVYAPSGESQQA